MQTKTNLNSNTPEVQTKTMNRRRFLRGLALMTGLTILPKATAPAAPAAPEPDSALTEWRDLLAQRKAYAAKYPERFAIIQRWEDYFGEVSHIMGEFTSELYEASIQDPEAVAGHTLYDWSHRLKDAIEDLNARMEEPAFDRVLEAATGTSATVLCIEWYIRQDPTKEWQPEIDDLRDSYPAEAARLQVLLNSLLDGAK